MSKNKLVASIEKISADSSKDERFNFADRMVGSRNNNSIIEQENPIEVKNNSEELTKKNKTGKTTTIVLHEIDRERLSKARKRLSDYDPANIHLIRIGLALLETVDDETLFEICEEIKRSI